MVWGEARAFVVAGFLVLGGGCQLLIGLDAGNPRATASGTGGVGGEAAGTGTSTTSAGGSSSSSSTTSSSSNSSSGATCGIGHLVISEIRSRGPNQGADEFIELFNATGAAVRLDGTWQITERAAGESAYGVRWTGKGKSVPAWGHYLIAGSAYTQMPTPDDVDTTGISDASSLVLAHAGVTVDAVCYYYASNPFNDTYTCEGMPALNPHNMTTSTDSDASIARSPGGAGGNCTDTDDNAADFIVEMPSTPESTASPPTP